MVKLPVELNIPNQHGPEKLYPYGKTSSSRSVTYSRLQHYFFSCSKDKSRDAMASATSWWSPSWLKRSEDDKKNVVEEEALHRKRLAAILRYIASMHEGISCSGGDARQNFVRPLYDNGVPSDFFQHETTNSIEEENGVLFSTNDFRKLISVETVDDDSISVKSSPPFSFYAPAQYASNHRGQVGGGMESKSPSLYGLSSVFAPSNNLQGRRNRSDRGLWLRLTRLGPSSLIERPKYDHPALQTYLNGWLKDSSTARSIDDLLTLKNLDRAPSISVAVSVRNHRLIKKFLHSYKTHLRMKMYQRTLEPMYNSLFEWNQQQNENNEEIVWGLGHAKMLTVDGRLINGPILEVLVEVELAPDGALLIRPREHTGVTLNREVIAALVATGPDPSSLNSASQLYKAVATMETSAISPGQPQTYVPFLKRVAMELSSGGAFRASSDTISQGTTHLSKLKVSEAWCLYARSKPNSARARDANLLADRVGNYREFIPLATWSLTHGSSKLEEKLQQNLVHVAGESNLNSLVKKEQNSTWLRYKMLSDGSGSLEARKEKEPTYSNRPIFPLATSESQNRIADLLLCQNYPAVVAEGPPGTGKTHTIANIVSAYLCEGKRVLVTSKNANALCVLRSRLPQSVRELVVDVSMSESQGMRQLQQTVERLAVRVSVASTDIESEKCDLLQRAINDLEIKLEGIDRKMTTESEQVRQLLQQPDGLKLITKSDDLMKAAPWLMRTLSKMNLKSVKFLAQEVKKLQLDLDDPLFSVAGFDSPPSKSVISLASAKSGSPLSSLSQATKATLASLPIVGPALETHIAKVNEELDKLYLNGNKPESSDDWKIVTKALKHSLSVCTFEDNIWRPLVKEKRWPRISFKDQKVVNEIHSLFELAADVKELHVLLDTENAMKTIAECRKLDPIRTRLSHQKQHHSEDLADAAVVSELSRSFSPDAQSALIKFAQIAGSSKFSRSAKPSKMSQRQRRRRQEYLSAFDRCCRFIPCWILTTSQISDYLPAECLFDLVVIDESSQSDVSVLPGMMRGKQWLIVGDGKQVSPTEAFVSEENIENLRATLPDSPLEDALLPGRSFFDLCAQAFPRGRVVLTEHFRCAPEIIHFSNDQFYDGRLIPVRLPTRKERLTPSIVDVKVAGGTKVGKINEKEADTIVKMIKEIMMESSERILKPRSIGVISLVGDEQSRLIRGRLLDACGPEYLARHDVLIGDPPLFQGAERDIVFLSMVCSRENMVTQSQQFHYQRANVALSRARDRVVLVRSVDLRDIPSLDDVKIPIIEFFMGANVSPRSVDVSGEIEGRIMSRRPKQYFGREILRSFLLRKGYRIIDMSMVWENAFCVENEDSDTRVAIMVDCEEPQRSDWLLSYKQQKAIERVGWKCFRVDALSVVVDYVTAANSVVQVLAAHGIFEPNDMCPVQKGVGNEDANSLKQNRELTNDDDKDEVITITSEDNERVREEPEVECTIPDQAKSSVDFDRDEPIEPWQLGEVVNLDFLRGTNNKSDVAYDYDNDNTLDGGKTMLDQDEKQETNILKRPPSDGHREEEDEDNELDCLHVRVDDDTRAGDAKCSPGTSFKGRLRKRRKIAEHHRDQISSPNKETERQDETNTDWCDTDSDIRDGNVEDDESWNGDTGEQNFEEVPIGFAT